MPRFSTRSPQAVLAGLVLLAGSAAAQAPAPTAAPPPAAPVAPVSVAPAIDPHVTALFNQAIAAHQAQTALSATIIAATTGLGNSANSQSITLAFQRTLGARIAVADSTGPVVQFVSDGKTLTIYAVHDKKYRTDTVPAGANVIPAVLVQSHALLPRLIGQPEALSELLAQPGVTASVVSPALAVPVPVGGAAVDTVSATLPAPDGSKVLFTIDIGKTDHLLRRIVQTATVTKNGTQATFTHTESVTALDTAPTLTAADFAFTPPAGATKITLVAPPKTGQTATPNVPPSTPPLHDPRLVPGAKPFTLAVKDWNGKLLSLSQYRGHVVLLDFWATWCGPCVGEMPNVIAAFKKYHAQGFDIVGISLDESRPALAAFVAKNKMPWRQVFDGKGWNSAAPRQYGVSAIPFGLLIGKDGQIAAVDVRGPALTAAIQEALAK